MSITDVVVGSAIGGGATLLGVGIQLFATGRQAKNQRVFAGQEARFDARRRAASEFLQHARAEADRIRQFIEKRGEHPGDAFPEEDWASPQYRTAYYEALIVAPALEGSISDVDRGLIDIRALDDGRFFEAVNAFIRAASTILAPEGVRRGRLRKLLGPFGVELE